MQILHDAFLDLKKNLGIMLKVSPVYETDPWGFESDQAFLNAVIKFETQHQPKEVLNILHYLEAKAGRERLGEGYSNRTLDLDLLYYNDLILEEPELQLPHPRISQRIFVLRPLADLDPDWLDARTQKKVSEMLAKVQDSGKIQIYPESLSETKN